MSAVIAIGKPPYRVNVIVSSASGPNPLTRPGRAAGNLPGPVERGAGTAGQNQPPAVPHFMQRSDAALLLAVVYDSLAFGALRF